MILPHNGNTPNQTFGSSTISPNEMWLALFAFHYPGMTDYQKSDQAFIDEWDAAIDMYGETFTGLTLVATTGSGLPDFGTTVTPVVPTLPIDFTNDCGNITMDCAAETTILSHFVSASAGGSNAKATQTSGVKASHAHTTDLGLDGVKLVSATTATFSTPSAQILGGAQFTTSVSQKPEKEGSSSIVEQALYNVLRVILTGTPAGGWYCEPTNLKDLPTAPLSYVQIYSNDFLYAATNSKTSVPVDEGTCHGTHSLSAQEELNTASQLLIFISEPELTGF
jgi:hypothetical protein